MSLTNTQVYATIISWLLPLICIIAYITWVWDEPFTLLISNNDAISIKNISKMIKSFKHFKFYNNNIDLPVPALIIAGPPKTGTNTLLSELSKYPDFYAYPTEHFYWGTAAPGEIGPCDPILNQSQWNKYLNMYKNNLNQTRLSTFIKLINLSNNNSIKHCNAKSFIQTFKNLRIDSYPSGQTRFGHRFDHKDCINPLDKYKYNNNNNNNNNKEYIEYCWLFEKAPAYAKNPFVSIQIANLLPKTKYLTILRNPKDQLWSMYFHFGGGVLNKWEELGNDAREKDVIIQIENVTSIIYLNKVCNNIHLKYKQIIKNNIINNKKERYLLMRDYFKTLIIEYFKSRYIKPKDIDLKWPGHRFTKVIWATYYIPILFIGLFVNDEVFINNKWNKWDPINNEILNYKYIQFEWLWNDTLDSMRLLKCWITQGFRINNNKCEFKRNDEINKYLFSNINKTNTRNKKGVKWSKWYGEQVSILYSPCNDLIDKVLLNDRPNLLLGQWIQWL